MRNIDIFPPKVLINKERYGITKTYLLGFEDSDFAKLYGCAVMDTNGKYSLAKALPDLDTIQIFMNRLFSYVPKAVISANGKTTPPNDVAYSSHFQFHGAFRIDHYGMKTPIPFSMIETVLKQMMKPGQPWDPQSVPLSIARVQMFAMLKMLLAGKQIQISDRVIKLTYRDFVFPTSSQIESDMLFGLSINLVIEGFKKALDTWVNSTSSGDVIPLNMQTSFNEMVTHVNENSGRVWNVAGHMDTCVQYVASIVHYGVADVIAREVLPSSRIELCSIMNIFMEASQYLGQNARKEFTTEECHHINDFAIMLSEYKKLPIDFRSYDMVDRTMLKDWLQVQTIKGNVKDTTASVILRVGFSVNNYEVSSVEQSNDAHANTGERFYSDDAQSTQGAHRFYMDCNDLFGGKRLLSIYREQKILIGSNVKVISDLPKPITDTILEYIAHCSCDSLALIADSTVGYVGTVVRKMASRSMDDVQQIGDSNKIVTTNTEAFLILCMHENATGSLPTSVSNFARLLPDKKENQRRTYWVGANNFVTGRIQFQATLTDFSGVSFSSNFDLLHLFGASTNTNTLFVKSFLRDVLDKAYEEVVKDFKDVVYQKDVRTMLKKDVCDRARLFCSSAVENAYRKAGIKVPYIEDLDTVRNFALMNSAISVYLAAMSAIGLTNMAIFLTHLMFDQNRGYDDGSLYAFIYDKDIKFRFPAGENKW